MSNKFEPWLTEPTIWKAFLEESGHGEEFAKMQMGYSPIISLVRDHYNWFAKGFYHGGQS